MPSEDGDLLAHAGVFLSIAPDGSLLVDQAYIRPGDETMPERPRTGEDPVSGTPSGSGPEENTSLPVPSTKSTARSASPETPAADEEDSPPEKPLSERLMGELTAWRTLALQDALARNPEVAFLATSCAPRKTAKNG